LRDFCLIFSLILIQFKLQNNLKSKLIHFNFFRLKLFLDQFKIRACVLNSELPINIRCHTVEEYNNGRYDIIIASDEKFLSSKKSKGDNASGVSRGIDFRNVSNVINFDFPRDVNSYVHRAGRSARGNNQGNVLSFVALNEQNFMSLVEEHLMASFPAEHSSIIKKHNFKLEEVEPFKYRAQDAWFAVTKGAIKEARIKEIKKEITNSEKLKTHFEGCTRDLQVLQHDAPITIIKAQEHLSEVPDYIVPAPLKNLVGIVTKKRKNPASQRPKFVRENALEFPSSKKKRKF
jgi:ATP-dependent RNA helicase DDX56/DBP9